MKLDISFSDFWSGFEPEDFVVWQMLSETYELTLVENGQLHFFSSYGNAHLSRTGRKVFFSAENEGAPRFACDFSIGQRKPDSATHLYFPLWLIYYFLRTRNEGGMPARPPLRADWIERDGICSVISNEASSRRKKILDVLDSTLPITHGGRLLNNTGSPVANKFAFLQEHKFHVALENSIGDGYVTEKIFDAFLASCIPIYWGSRSVFDFFNPRAFIFVDEGDVSNQARRIDELLGDPSRAYKMMTEPLFSTGLDPEDWIDRLRHALIRNAAVAQNPRGRASKLFRQAMARAEYKVGILKYYAQKARGQNFR